jgi:hypothetical protein
MKPVGYTREAGKVFQVEHSVWRPDDLTREKWNSEACDFD